MNDAKRVMNRLTGNVHKVYKARHKKSGKFLVGRPPHDLVTTGGELYEKMDSIKRSYAQRDTYRADLGNIQFDEFEIVEYELDEVAVH